MLDEWVRKLSGQEENKIFDKWGKKGRLAVVILVCLGLMALIWPQNQKVTQETATPEVSSSSGVAQAKEKLAQDLETILSQVEGAGKVQVSITLNSDGLKSYARNTKNERRETQEADRSGGDRNITEDNQSSDIAVSGGSALLVEDYAPEVVGVLVVADGAGNGSIKEKLTDATVTLLNISPHQVRVVARKGEKL